MAEEIEVIVDDTQEEVSLFIDQGNASGVDSVNGKTGVVTLNSGEIPENTNLYYTESRVAANTAVALNTGKTGVTNEEENTINTELEAGMTGEDLVLNVLSLTTAEYDAGTPVATTFYIITDA